MTGVFRRAALALALAAGAAGARAQPALPPDVAAYTAARTADGPFVGLVVGVVDASGARAWGFGRTSTAADAPAPDGATRFEVGSVTKTFTALLLAEAAARGEVTLATPVGALLPDTLRLAPGVAALTLRQLVTHTSGLPRLPTNLGMPGAGLDLRDPYAAYSPARLHAFLADVRLDSARFAYSNVGAGLLGYLLARRAGTTYAALLADRITGPLGLGATGLAPDPARDATGHAGGAPVPFWTFTDALVGAGGVRASADDLLRYLAAHLGLVETPLADALRATHAVQAEASRGRGIALAWFTGGPDGRLRWHNGGTGGFTSFVGFDPATGRGVVVLSNAQASVDRLGMHLLDPTFPLAE